MRGAPIKGDADLFNGRRQAASRQRRHGQAEKEGGKFSHFSDPFSPRRTTGRLRKGKASLMLTEPSSMVLIVPGA